MTERDGMVLLKDCEILSKLIGNVVTLTSFQTRYNGKSMNYSKIFAIKRIKGIEIELINGQEYSNAKDKRILMKFDDGDSIYILNFDDLDRIIGKMGNYGSIREYLEDNGFSFSK